jgi:uncharacterized protein YkwD
MTRRERHEEEEEKGELVRRVKEVLPQLEEKTIEAIIEENPEAAESAERIIEIGLTLLTANGGGEEEEPEATARVSDTPAAMHVEETEEVRRAQLAADEALARELEREMRLTPSSSSTPTTAAAPPPPTKRKTMTTTEGEDQQLQEARMRMATRWKEQGGHSRMGMWDQIKDARAKLRTKWQAGSASGKAIAEIERRRVMTLADIDAVEREREGHWINPDREGSRALELTNAFRKEHGLPALKWSQKIADIGTEHSKAMAERRVPFGHAGFEGRALRIGGMSCAENVAFSAGLGDPAKVAVNGWIKSPGHRKNMLSHFDLCGIGVFRSGSKTYFTQLFRR